MNFREWFDDKTQVIFWAGTIAMCLILLVGIILFCMRDQPDNIKLDVIKTALQIVSNIVTGLFGIGIGRAIGKNNTEAK